MDIKVLDSERYDELIDNINGVLRQSLGRPFNSQTKAEIGWKIDGYLRDASRTCVIDDPIPMVWIYTMDDNMCRVCNTQGVWGFPNKPDELRVHIDYESLDNICERCKGDGCENSIGYNTL